PHPVFLPGGTNATSTAYIVWGTATATTRNVAMSRSTDGGARWSAAALLTTAFPANDQVVGCDRSHDMPDIAVAYATGQVFVVYQANNSAGEGDTALQIGSGVTFGARRLIDSNPGGDRAQFFPAVAVDQSTHRLHVVWYDQDVATNGGDLTEVMHSYSDDG